MRGIEFLEVLRTKGKILLWDNRYVTRIYKKRKVSDIM